MSCTAPRSGIPNARFEDKRRAPSCLTGGRQGCKTSIRPIRCRSRVALVRHCTACQRIPCISSRSARALPPPCSGRDNRRESPRPLDARRSGPHRDRQRGHDALAAIHQLAEARIRVLAANNPESHVRDEFLRRLSCAIRRQRPRVRTGRPRSTRRAPRLPAAGTPAAQLSPEDRRERAAHHAVYVCARIRSGLARLRLNKAGLELRLGPKSRIAQTSISPARMRPVASPPSTRYSEPVT